MWIVIMMDIMMAVIFLLMGLAFYRSKGRAADYLTGYNMRSEEERRQYNENELCKAFGKRVMFMAVPFLPGAMLDYIHAGVGTVIAWSIWIVLFVLLLIERYRREQLR